MIDGKVSHKELEQVTFQASHGSIRPKSSMEGTNINQETSKSPPKASLNTIK